MTNKPPKNMWFTFILTINLYSKADSKHEQEETFNHSNKHQAKTTQESSTSTTLKPSPHKRQKGQKPISLVHCPVAKDAVLYKKATEKAAKKKLTKHTATTQQ